MVINEKKKMKTMKKSPIYIMLMCLMAHTSCTRDHVDDVEFGVRIENENNLRVGTPVTFNFSGNAEYITFYSGEPGNNYANVHRNMVDIESMQLECTIKQQYTDKEYRLKEIVHAYISEDFDGQYTLESIEEATWQNVTGQEYGQIAVPQTRNNATEEVSSKVDWSDYKDQPFYLAFQYLASKRNDVPSSDGGGRYLMQPRVDINPLSLTRTTVDGLKLVWENAKTDWGFRIIYQKSTQQGNYQVSDGGLLFQPQKNKEHTDDDVIVWMVSRPINPKEVEPDRGTAIKSAEAYLPTYSHTYDKPGTYTATFIATNANLWDSERQIKEIKITINE
jgi:hypothetical protein